MEFLCDSNWWWHGWEKDRIEWQGGRVRPGEIYPMRPHLPPPSPPKRLLLLNHIYTCDSYILIILSILMYSYIRRVSSLLMLSSRPKRERENLFFFPLRLRVSINHDSFAPDNPISLIGFIILFSFFLSPTHSSDIPICTLSMWTMWPVNAWKTSFLNRTEHWRRSRLCLLASLFQ